MARAAFALVVGAVLLIAFPAFAQVNFGGTTALTISANPEYPGPNSIVTLTAESPLLDLEDSDIEWSVNGNSAGSGQSIKVPLGGLGQETDVSVSVSGESGNDSATLSLVPTSVDLLWEADSYVPPFYRGRAQAGSGSSIRVMAIPHFVNTDGTTVPSSEINFTWKLNGAIDETQSGLGESSAIFPAATLYDSDVIDVTAQAQGASLAGESSVTIRTLPPDLVLYEDNPLFGVTYYDALPQSSTASESDTSFAAVPYFANAASANDPSLAYAWTVNGSPVAAAPQDPSEITIDAESAGVASIGLSISNPSDPFFSVSGSWQVAFTESAEASSTDVFDSPQ